MYLCSSVVDKAWLMLKLYLETHDPSHNHQLQKCVARKLLSLGSHLPQWIVKTYKVCGWGCGNIPCNASMTCICTYTCSYCVLMYMYMFSYLHLVTYLSNQNGSYNWRVIIYLPSYFRHIRSHVKTSPCMVICYPSPNLYKV